MCGINGANETVKNYFENIIKKSWTWEKLTEEERKTFENHPQFELCKGTEKQRIELLNLAYYCFLLGCGYPTNCTGWREDKKNETN